VPCNLAPFNLSLWINKKTMKKVILLLIFGWTIAVLNPAHSQNRRDDGEVPLQISLIYPISTNGLMAYEKTNNLSLNLFMGLNGGLNGIELGGFLNVNQYAAKGIQMGGFGNFNGDGMGGIQLSGFGNVNMGHTRGLQGAGFLNLNTGTTHAIQLSGFANVCGSFSGIQAAGFVNVASDVGIPDTSVGKKITTDLDKSGIQLSGFINVANDVNGVQAAGFINVANNVKGIQLAGFINVCDSLDGVSFALINYIRKNGYRKITLSTNEVFYLNTGYKMGTEKFYTLFNLGYRPGAQPYNWSTGLGFGTALHVKNNQYLDIETVQHIIFDPDLWNNSNNHGSYVFHQLKLNFRYQNPKGIGIFGGPSFNLMSARRTHKEWALTPAWSLESWTRNNHSVNFWFGFNAGLQF
jgi:hypothetical protein